MEALFVALTLRNGGRKRAPIKCASRPRHATPIACLPPPSYPRPPTTIARGTTKRSRRGSSWDEREGKTEDGREGKRWGERDIRPWRVSRFSPGSPKTTRALYGPSSTTTTVHRGTTRCRPLLRQPSGPARRPRLSPAPREPTTPLPALERACATSLALDKPSDPSPKSQHHFSCPRESLPRLSLLLTNPAPVPRLSPTTINAAPGPPPLPTRGERSDGACVSLPSRELETRHPVSRPRQGPYRRTRPTTSLRPSTALLLQGGSRMRHATPIA
jgi:hypothetical protein